MQSEAVMKELIMNFADQDDRVRAVLLNGSRANPNIAKDAYQDFDIVYVVTDLDSFISDHSWVNIFGERVMMQLPDTMQFIGVDPICKPISFGYLMQFKDGNRIDLTLFPLKKIQRDFRIDSLTIVWLDKDGLFQNVLQSNDKDYHIIKPTQQEFSEVCNEFWWVSMNVVKGLQKKQLTYSKEMIEQYTRPMFMRMLAWKIGSENHFAVSFGKAGSLMQRYLTEDLYAEVLKTYSGIEWYENSAALLRMMDLFKRICGTVASSLQFEVDEIEQENVLSYVKAILS